MAKKLDGSELGPLAKALKEFLSGRIVGQERAVKDLAAAADLYEAGFRDIDRPVYSALFLGPSGVGKTLTAEVLAEFFFGNRLALTKVACADYQEPHAIAKLIGSPPGYVGFWNPDDKQYGGSEPILSQYNVDKHDFFYQQENNEETREINKKLKVLQERMLSLKNVYDNHQAKGIAKLQELIKKNEKELKEISDQVQEIEKEYEELYNSNPGSPKLSTLNKKLSALEGRLMQEQDKRFRAQAEEQHKLETELAGLFNAGQKAAQEYEMLIKQKEKRFKYSPDANYRSIILFDEIEKANPSLLRLLLEILDKGRLTLSNGKITRLTNSFILLTSNIGSAEISQMLTRTGIGFKAPDESQGTAGELDEQIYRETLSRAVKILPPEFRGRLNNMIVFRPLGRENLRAILDLQINEFYNVMTKNKFPIILKMDQVIKDFLIDEATDRMDYGARLLKNKLRKYIIEPLARLKNRGEIKTGDIICVCLDEEGSRKKIYFQREDQENKTE